MKKRFNLIILLCLVLGIIGGLIIPDFISKISFLGTVYINLLKFMIMPIIFTTITVTMYNSKINNKLLFKTVILFILMFMITFIVTSLIVSLFGSSINPQNLVVGEVQANPLKISEIIINLFPDNLITMFTNNAVFACIIFALCCGFASSKVENGKKVIELIEGLRNVFNKLLEWVMYLTPIGVFALAGASSANYGKTIIGLAANYIGLAYLCGIISLILIMIMPIWLVNKINPLKYVKKMTKLWILTMSTCSSLATLPTTIEVCKKEFKVNSQNADLLVPIGCTIHKCGGAVSFALLGIFCCNLFGIEITFYNYLIMMFSALFINMAAPGIPSGGIVLGATYLMMLNIPLSFIGIYSGIYRILDMLYTSLNVTGNVSANILINYNTK